MKNSEQIHLVDDLQGLLEKQIEFAVKGNLDGVERIGLQTRSLVEKLSPTGVLKKPGFEKKRQQIEKLYERLLLMFTVQKGQVAGQLKRISDGKKTLKAYRANS